MISKSDRRNKIKARIRGRISGTPERPRLCVFRSNKQIYAQVIDDIAGTTRAKSPLRWARPLPRKPSRLASTPLCLTAMASFSMVELNRWPTAHAKADLNFKNHHVEEK